MAAHDGGDSVILNKKGSRIICGTPTDVVCMGFSNKIFVIVTQYKRIGTLIEVQREDIYRKASSDESISFASNVLLGTDEPTYHLFAKKIAFEISKQSGTSKPILLGIALKDKSVANMKETINFVMDLEVW